jgi:predicted transposase/invertase (TIGR01784 family)
MPEHDPSYKRLFSHPRMVEDLLRGFVAEEWVEQIDFNTLETVKDSFISDDLKARHDDIIWKARWGNTDLYVFLLLEFQSTPDYFMPVRLLVYIGLLYQHLIDAEQYKKTDKLPPVLPIVIYNGESTWDGPAEIRTLIADVPRGLEKYLPRLHCLILDESTFPDTQLRTMHNLVAALFRLENSRAGNNQAEVLAGLREVLVVLIDWLNAPEQDGLRRDFTIWLRRVLLPARVPDVSVPEITELQEMNDMLYETVQGWYREAEAKGEARGITIGEARGEAKGITIGEARGEAKGKTEGKADFLLKMLELKFGPLEAEIRERVYKLDNAALEKCAERLLQAESLWEVLGNAGLH